MATLPLNRTRLLAIAALYEPGLAIEMRGGWDTGVYFVFSGRMTGTPPVGVAHGRILRRWGFDSEALEISRDEQFGRAGLNAGIAAFFARCEARRVRFARWIAEADALRTAEACVGHQHTP